MTKNRGGANSDRNGTGKKIHVFFARIKKSYYLCNPVDSIKGSTYTVDVAQLVRASDCGPEGRGFKPHLPPENEIR